MVKRHLIRGNNEKLFFAETHHNGSKIFRIDTGKEYGRNGSIYEVFELKESTIIFFEPDNEIIEKNSKKQAVFIVDDKMQMRHLVSEDDKPFQQATVFDLSHLEEIL